MIKRLTSLIRRIVGRIIKMANRIMQYGVTLIPLGFMVLFFSFQFLDGWELYAVFVSSVLIIILGFTSFFLALKWGREEDTKSHADFKELLKEVKGLRQDLNKRGGDNDTRNNTTKDKL